VRDWRRYAWAVASLWGALGVIAALLAFVYGLPRALCDTPACPSAHWLAPVLLVLAAVGLVATAATLLVVHRRRQPQRANHLRRDAAAERRSSDHPAR
jgi:uncharacterized membrane protein